MLKKHEKMLSFELFHVGNDCKVSFTIVKKKKVRRMK